MHTPMQDPKFDESRNPNIPAAGYRWIELKQMIGYLVVTVLVIWLAVEALIAAAPKLVSLEREQRRFAFIGTHLADSEDIVREPKLQALADDIAQRMNLPAGSLKVFLDKGETVNAYATFGGHIVLYRGLLEKLPDEATVAAVLAHEAAHVKHRDMLRGMSRSLLFSLAGYAVFGNDGSLNALMSADGLRYSRDLERRADEAAAHAVYARYGDVGGMIRVLDVLSSESGNEPPAWLSDHPHGSERSSNIRKLAANHHYPENGKTPPPNPFRQPEKP
ncbi:MAG: M48 family metallopeptidase [Conchiformibius sp.]|nr:M48 family metallopeptidase [Conchiformibius sp.]